MPTSVLEFFLEAAGKASSKVRSFNGGVTLQSVDVLILGGGIHGVGVLHDLASRGIEAVLLEKSHVGAGTSSKSTKLIHGGLRYLRNIGDFHLVREALRERHLLSKLAPDIVQPIRLVIPEASWWQSVVVSCGIGLYRNLAGSRSLGPNKKISKQEVEDLVPLLDSDHFSRFHCYWDGQTDDLSLVRRVAASASLLGARIFENCQATQLTDDGQHFTTSFRNLANKTEQLKSRCIINCLGPWANTFLIENGFSPQYIADSNKGIHLVVRDFGLKAGLFLPVEGGRFIFVLPWEGSTLIGTTEGLFSGNPDHCEADEAEIKYLLDKINNFINPQLTPDDIQYVFAGIRWLPHQPEKSITRASRESVLAVEERNGKLLATLYGGKLTTYRSFSEEIGDLVAKNLGVRKPSRTMESDSWTSEPQPWVNFPQRFEVHKTG